MQCLKYLHWHGMIYKDIKTNNVLMSLQRDIKLSEWGIFIIIPSHFINVKKTLADFLLCAVIAFVNIQLWILHTDLSPGALKADNNDGNAILHGARGCDAQGV